MRPLISIVIPTYNRAPDLKRALKSVLAQTYPHWEALVVDNQSSDNTDAVIYELGDSRIKPLKIQNNGVIAASRNLGIKNAAGEYIAFLDSDDWWMPEKLEESLKYLEQGADVVYHDLFLVRKMGQGFLWRKARTRRLKRPIFNDLVINGNALNNSSVVVRKYLLDEINGLSENRNLIAIEDYDAWLRIAKLTEKFQRIHKTLGYYWVGGGNVSSPTRLLQNLDAIEERFSQDMTRWLGRCHLYWIYYAKGKAHYHLGSYEVAKKNFKRVLCRHAPLKLIIKSSCMLLLLSRSHIIRAHKTLVD